MTENIVDDTAQEIDAIANMVKHANENGLLVEVIYSFHSSASSGYGVIESCEYALNEWDI